MNFPGIDRADDPRWGYEPGTSLIEGEPAAQRYGDTVALMKMSGHVALPVVGVKELNVSGVERD
jgi:hypothetical protein